MNSSWDDYDNYHSTDSGDYECIECSAPISGSEHQDGGLCGTCLQDRDCE